MERWPVGTAQQIGNSPDQVDVFLVLGFICHRVSFLNRGNGSNHHNAETVWKSTGIEKSIVKTGGWIRQE
jgi:hypothetical protein